MSKNNLKFSPVTDLEVLEKSIQYLSFLLPELPFNLLKDSCRGAIALLFNLRNYFKYYCPNGNNEK